ncbi:MAG: histidine kinase N-terminal 7TM domain-containing protein [Anaerolineales bacterium]|nr:histidine kinase N-terminal 7TM domain-containing protein [Anaerolineales bacterium]
MQLQLLILFLLIITFAVGAILVFLKRTFGSFSLGLLVIIIAAWIAAYHFYRLLSAPDYFQVLRAVHYFFQVCAATTVFYFALSFTNRSHWMIKSRIIFFLIEPAVIQILFWTQPGREMFFSPGHGLGEQINLIYVLAILIGSIVLLVDTFLHKPRAYFLRAGMIMIGALFPLFGTLSTIFSHNFEVNLLTLILSYGLAIAGFVFGKFNSASLELTPMNREIAIDGMDDGWMVIDNQDNIIDLNSSAETMVGLSRETIYGQSITRVLTDWPRISQAPEGIKELEMRRSVKSHSGWRYLNIRVSQLKNKQNEKIGQLIIWRDITGRKLADEAHQRARDELFVLLNSISSTANRSSNMEEFLSETSYQILYSFHSQAVAVFLTEDEEGRKQTLSLKSHFGLAPEQLKELESKATTSNLQNWLLQNNENRPLTIDSFDASVEAPVRLINIGHMFATLIPLITYTQHENSILGCLYLSRKENTPYSQDELIRLTTIANQIATLIDSSRKRQSSIALSERQRLLRDLHDSVSQKLYGLVALTEAAQAGIEAGSDIPPLQVLTRIGENARQAVKEMRLFLHEMQPIDLKDGLVSSLHNRLAAVEGRADIRARLLSDDKILLSKEKEIALYFIAQEALNNILRHARAKNVVVSIKQTRQSVKLEIKDDGQGFDMDKVDMTGMGLRNMKERALLVRGTFKASSTAGKGTRILVTGTKKG